MRVFIGYDPREDVAFQVCRASLLGRAVNPDRLQVTALDLPKLRAAALYWRQEFEERGQRFDLIDGRPFSSDFSFTRFLVPALCLWQGWALFCDSDFLWLNDVDRLFAFADESKALQVVMHDLQNESGTKMRGQVQEGYPFKGASSLMLINCGHPANRALTPGVVNSLAGRMLHSFAWLDDPGLIGALSLEWNWLAGISDAEVRPSAVHFTRGTPDHPGHEDDPYADAWRRWRRVAGV